MDTIYQWCVDTRQDIFLLNIDVVLFIVGAPLVFLMCIDMINWALDRKTANLLWWRFITLNTGDVFMFVPFLLACAMVLVAVPIVLHMFVCGAVLKFYVLESNIVGHVARVLLDNYRWVYIIIPALVATAAIALRVALRKRRQRKELYHALRAAEDKR